MDDKSVFNIQEKIAVLKTYPTGWTKELNLVSWNGNTVKYDIRDWDPDHKYMSGGITLYKGEMQRLMKAMQKRIQKQD